MADYRLSKLHKRHLAFNDGIADIYDIKNIAAEGDAPKDGLINKRSVRFEIRTAGMTRFFAGMNNQLKVDRMILIHSLAGVSPKCAAVIGGVQYKVIQVQEKTDTAPRTMLLTLSALEKNYQIKAGDDL